MIFIRRYFKNTPFAFRKDKSFLKIRKYTTNFDFVNASPTRSIPHTNLSKEGVVADPSFLTNASTLPHNPWKIVLIDIDPRANEIDIESAFENIGQSEIVISDVEIFTERVGGNKRRNAFIYLSSQEDMNKLLNNSIRVFGVNIKGKRSAILSTEDKKTIIISTSKKVFTDNFYDILLSLGIHESDADLFVPKDSNGRIKGNIYATFSSHNKAYTVWKFIKNRPTLNIFAAWTQKTGVELVKLSSAKDYLEKENIELRRQLETISSNQADRKSVV